MRKKSGEDGAGPDEEAIRIVCSLLRLGRHDFLAEQSHFRGMWKIV